MITAALAQASSSAFHHDEPLPCCKQIQCCAQANQLNSRGAVALACNQRQCCKHEAEAAEPMQTRLTSSSLSKGGRGAPLKLKPNMLSSTRSYCSARECCCSCSASGKGMLRDSSWVTSPLYSGLSVRLG